MGRCDAGSRSQLHYVQWPTVMRRSPMYMCLPGVWWVPRAGLLLVVNSRTASDLYYPIPRPPASLCTQGGELAADPLVGLRTAEDSDADTAAFEGEAGCDPLLACKAGT
jgi:hypothetical protein